MLSIAPLSRSSFEYLTKETLADAELLYGPSLYTWLGGAASALGLEASSSPTQLNRLLEGKHPNGKQLVQHQERRDGTSRQLGWDLTFNAPKSISVLWSMVGEKDRRLIESIHSKAVHKAFDYLEREAGIARRGAQGTRAEYCSLVGVGFPHGTSRANEPHLHEHFVVPNLGLRQDGTWGAIRSRDLYQHQAAANGVYVLEIAHGLRQAGIPLEKVKRWVEVNGVPQELREAMSSRRADVLSHSPSNAAEAQRAAYVTRGPKDRTVSIEELRGKWATIANNFSFTRQKATELMRAARRPVENFAKEWAIDRAVILGAHRLAEREPTFSKADLVTSVCTRLLKRGLSADEVLKGIDDRLEKRFHAVCVKNEPGRKLCATLDDSKSSLPLNQRFSAEQQRDGVKLPREVNGTSPTPKWEAATWRLGDQEKAALNATLAQGKALRVVVTPPGEAANRLLAASAELHRRGGTKVVNIAPSDFQARALEADVGGTAYTVGEVLDALDETHTRNLVRTAFNRPTQERIRLTSNTLVQVAGCEKLTRTELQELSEAVTESGATLLLAGSVGQDSNEESTSAFSEAVRDVASRATLEGPSRESESWQLRTRGQLQFGDARGAMAEFAAHGKLHASSSYNLADKALVGKWGKAVEAERSARRTAIIAQSPADVPKLNQDAQAELLSRGLLSRRHARSGSNRFYEGDAVRMSFSSRDSGFRKGDQGVIESIKSASWLASPDEKVVTVRLERPSRLGIFTQKHTRLRFEAKDLTDSIELAYARKLSDARTPGGFRQAFVKCSPSSLVETQELAELLESTDSRASFFTSEDSCSETVLNLVYEARVEQEHERHLQELARQQQEEKQLQARGIKKL